MHKPDGKRILGGSKSPFASKTGSLSNRVDSGTSAFSGEEVRGRQRVESADDRRIAVHLSGVSKVFRAGGQLRRALTDISLSIFEKEFFTLIGPSGCGKTTMLRCIAGLEHPTAGEIAIGNEVVFSPSRMVPAEGRPLAMVFQSYAIWPHMTVWQNAEFVLRYGRREVRQERGERDRTVRSVLERFGLGSYAEAWPGELSGGQQQRLALARAILAQPKVILLDEPLSNLDSKLRSRMRQELRDFHREFAMTIIYVTHDRHEALSLSDRVAVLSEGSLVQVGTPEELYREPASGFIADFIADANLFPGEVRESAGKKVLVSCEIGSLVCCATTRVTKGDKVVVAIWPEELSVRVGTTSVGRQQEKVGLEDKAEQDPSIPNGGVSQLAEDLSVAQQGSNSPPYAHSNENAINGLVRGKEYLGERVRYYVEANGAGVSVVSQPSAIIDVGTLVTLYVAWENTKVLPKI